MYFNFNSNSFLLLLVRHQLLLAWHLLLVTRFATATWLVLMRLINNAGAVFDESGTVDEVEITFATPLASVADETSDWNA